MRPPQRYSRGLSFLLALFFANINGSSGTEAERRLFSHLFDNYTKEVRPVSRHADTLCLEFGISISQLHEVKEKDQVMKTSLWLEQNWTDINLHWVPSAYENITTIRVPSDWIWQPDIVLYNNADGQYEVTLKTKALIRHTGQVEWTPPAIYKSSCEIDVKYFPFDMQICKMKFGSWTYDAVLVDLYLRRPQVDQQGYSQNGEWELMDAPGFKHVIVYDSCCGPAHYTDITYYFVLTRKPLFYTVNLIIPCVLISFLTVLVFYLPSDCGEKITLCISVLLALTVFLLLIAEIIPATSLVVPLIGNYLLFTMVMVTLSIIITVIVLNVHHRAPSTHTMPDWVKLVFLQVLPKLLLMHRPEKDDPGSTRDPFRYSNSAPGGDMTQAPVGGSSGGGGVGGLLHHLSNHCQTNRQSPKPSHDATSKGNHTLPDNHHFANTWQANSFLSPNQASGARRLSRYSLRHEDFITDADISQVPSPLESSGFSGNANLNTQSSLSVDIRRAIEGVQYIAKHLKNEDEFNSVSEDWKYVAMVLDRLFLWVFVVICIVGTCSIILNAPMIIDPDNAYKGIKDDNLQENACGQGFWTVHK